MKSAREFYGKLLPALGFKTDRSDAEYGIFYADGSGKPSEFFAFNEDRQHVPNETRIAFWAETRDEVDRIAKILREIGAKNIEGPAVEPEYSPGYYACFFEDPDGNKLEICCREQPVIST